MNADIEDTVENCSTYLDFLETHPKDKTTTQNARDV